MKEPFVKVTPQTIVQSLRPENADRVKLRHSREVLAGSVFGGEFFQPNPFFFSRESATLHLVGQYRGASAFLIAGGPSFLEIDQGPLTRVWSMTLNNAARSFRSNANCTVDDPSRFSMSMWLNPLIQKFVPMAQFEKLLWDNRLLTVSGERLQRWGPAKMKVGDCPNVVGFRRNSKFHAPRYLYEDTINWGNDAKFGGGRSVMLAAIRILFMLGFRKIYLLGVDFEMSATKKYHFDEQRQEGAIRGNMATYAKLQERFTVLQPYFLRAGLTIKNCNPRSRLTAFPFMPYEEAIAEATWSLGDPRNERTDGMYAPHEQKLAESSTPGTAGVFREAAASSADPKASG